MQWWRWSEYLCAGMEALSSSRLKIDQNFRIMENEELNRQLRKYMEEQNNRPVPDFEGYSPYEMERIFYFPFEDGCPIQLKRLSESDYKKIPLLNQVKFIADLIKNSGEIKLTKKGFLPTKIVKEIYNQGFLKDARLEHFGYKLYKETDSPTIYLSRILLEISGLTKKRHGKLTLTKKADKLLSDDEALLKLIFTTFGKRFNWGYFDGYNDENIGRLGFAFSLILIHKYGETKRPSSFYAKKYFKAFPMLLKNVVPDYGSIERYSSRCYSIRTFDRFCTIGLHIPPFCEIINELYII